MRVSSLKIQFPNSGQSWCFSPRKVSKGSCVIICASRVSSLLCVSLSHQTSWCTHTSSWLCVGTQHSPTDSVFVIGSALCFSLGLHCMYLQPYVQIRTIWKSVSEQRQFSSWYWRCHLSTDDARLTVSSLSIATERNDNLYFTCYCFSETYICPILSFLLTILIL